AVQQIETAPAGGCGVVGGERTGDCYGLVIRVFPYVFVLPLELPVTSGYDLLYKITPEPNANWDSAAQVPYAINNAADLNDVAIGRVGYYVETIDNNGNAFWVWATLKAPTTDLAKLGVPTDWTFDQQVFDLTVQSNKPGIPTLSGVSGGNMEFWPDCYVTGSNTIYDYDDDSNGSTDCFGSMQIHYGGQTIFAFNGWSAANADDFGVGSQPVAHPDWTFAANVAQYAVKNVYVFVQPLDPQAETAGYQPVYALDIPSGAVNWDTAAQVPYSLNNTALLGGPISRYGYYVELVSGGNFYWVWASMAALHPSAVKAGIPVDDVFDGAVNNLTIKTNHPGITPVTNSSGGKVEFWSNCYSVGANNVYDYDDDTAGTDCYGSMQLFSGTNTVFALNAWSYGTTAVDIGLGNSPGPHPDWTFAANAGNYSIRRMVVYVKQ
ncbi:MAG: hypothetical protein HUU55_17815, partial [Myxococcales bacterium]|nr:hypothetical protein [Myxococcales bacterium]